MSDTASPSSPLTPRVQLLMAVACGLCAGANYLNQPLLHSIALDFGIPDGRASVLVTCAQVSYALGLLLLVPLGDMLERRRLVLGLMGLAALGLLMSAASPHLPGGFSWLVAGTLTTGLFSVAAQVLVPLASLLAAPTHAGRAVGFVMAGLLVGILLARTVAGVLSGLGGWSLSYWVTGAAMLAVALLLANALKAAKAAAQKMPPRSPASHGPLPPEGAAFCLGAARRQKQAGAAAAPSPKLSYVQVLASMGTLLKAEPRLRSRTLLGAFSFGSVSVLFSTMALLLGGPAHGLSDAAIGLIGLAGVTGALMANAAGRLADRGLAAPTTAAGAALLLASWLPLWWGGHSVWAFIAGMLLIDLALQAVHICNQNVIYALAPQARSRINAVYMTGYFIGASTGSAVGAAAWLRHGWAGACLAGLALGLCNVAALVWDRRLVKSEFMQYPSVSVDVKTENR